MTTIKVAGAAVLCVVSLIAPQAVAGAEGTGTSAMGPTGHYTRENGDSVNVWIDKGLLYCKIVKGKKPNFEMCHGMKLTGNAWTGKKMKHPGMPGFMTFNGTVTYDAQSLSIKGCAMGKSMCDKETWKRMPG